MYKHIHACISKHLLGQRPPLDSKDNAIFTSHADGSAASSYGFHCIFHLEEMPVRTEHCDGTIIRHVDCCYLLLPTVLLRLYLSIYSNDIVSVFSLMRCEMIVAETKRKVAAPLSSIFASLSLKSPLFKEETEISLASESIASMARCIIQQLFLSERQRNEHYLSIMAHGMGTAHGMARHQSSKPFIQSWMAKRFRTLHAALPLAEKKLLDDTSRHGCY